MQQLLASLVVAMSVKDAAFETGMSAARANVKKTEQDFVKSTDGMGNAVQQVANRVNQAMVAVGESMASAAQSVTRAGVALTAGMTVPLALIGRRSKDTAGDFQSAMNRVRSAMLDASPDNLAKLANAAMTLGPAMGRSSIEAAGAIEMLAKNGMSAAAILNGGLTSALQLATVGQTDLSSASDLTTDILAQFGKTSTDLPNIVNKVSGALDASKMGFDDYRLAIGQAGGVAGGLGVPFEDLNVALAATASTFASGSDAGTSFKTFLTSLNPSSKEAEKVMKALGISFFDAAGSAKPLAEVADILRDKLGNLSDQSRREALTTMFGADGMRTAIALMNQGADGIDRVRGAIDKVTAAQKLKVLLDGDAAASQRMAAAAENLAIKLGQILLPVFTAVKDAIASVLTTLASAPAWFHTAAVAIGVMTAAIGPMMLAAVTLAKVALPLLMLRLGPIALGFAALVNPIGVVVMLLGRLAMQAGAATVLGMVGARLAAMAGPLGIGITLLTMLGPLLFRTATASDAVRKSQDAANAAMDRAKERSLQLATATGKLRVELIAKAKADGAAAVAALKKSVADMAAARATLARAKAEAAAQDQASKFAAGSAAGPGAGAMMRESGRQGVRQAEEDLKGTIDVVKTWNSTVQGLIADIRGASAADTGTQNIDFSDPEKAKTPKQGRDAKRDQSQYLDELGRIRVATLEATADLNGAISARYEAVVAAIEEERASYARSVALDEGLSAAKQATLIAAKDAELEQRRQVADQQRVRDLAQQRYDLDKAINDASQEVVRAQIDLADSFAGRRAGALRLLELQRQQEEADLDLILATEAMSSAAWANANARKDQLNAVYATRANAIVRDTEGPLAQYRRDLNRSADAVNESMEAIQVSGFERLNDWMADAVTGAGDLAKAFKDMATSMIADIARVVIRQNLIKPLVGALSGSIGNLFGTAPVGGAPGEVEAITGAWMRSYGGGKASGGRVSAGSWYMVGENGPEPFMPDGNGTVLPNSVLKGGRGGEVRLSVVRGEMFEPVVESISGGVSVRVAQGSNQRAAFAARQSLTR